MGCVLKTPVRHHLPDVRKGITKKVVIGGRNIYVTTGEYEDGTLGEVFVKYGKHGEKDSVYNIAAIAISIGLQSGIPLEVFVDKFKGYRCDPQGVTSDLDIPMCSGVMDWLVRRLDKDYGWKERKSE